MATTSAQILMTGAVNAIKSGDDSSADALFREYVGAMAGTLPHAAMVEADLPALREGVKQHFGHEQTGAWYGKPDADTVARVDAFFGLLQQAATRIDQLERPINTKLQGSKAITRDLGTLRDLMIDIRGAFEELARLGMSRPYDMTREQWDAKVSENLTTFRTLRRQAAEILIPLEKFKDRMNASQLESYQWHHDRLIAMIREVRGPMMLNG
jgi:hypothetical protein